MKICEYTWLPSHTRHCQKGPFLSTTIQNTEVNYMTGEQEGAERTEARNQNLMYQRDVNLTNFFEDSSKKSTYEPLEMHHLGISSTSPWSLSMYRIPYSKHAHSMASPLHVSLRVANVSDCRGIMRTCRKAVQLCGTGKKKAHKVEP